MRSVFTLDLANFWLMLLGENAMGKFGLKCTFWLLDIIQNIKRIPSCVIRGSRALTTCPKVAEPTVPPTPLN